MPASRLLAIDAASVKFIPAMVRNAYFVATHGTLIERRFRPHTTYDAATLNAIINHLMPIDA
jgi:hypothetical protein